MFFTSKINVWVDIIVSLLHALLLVHLLLFTLYHLYYYVI